MSSFSSPSNAPRWFAFLKGSHVVSVLELVQDMIVISLCIGLFSFMVMQLREMFLSLLPPLDFPQVTADILFLLILVELFRLLIIYLKEHRVSIGVAVEVSIVSVLRGNYCAGSARNSVDSGAGDLCLSVGAGGLAGHSRVDSAYFRWH